jgi:NAD+ kinase
MLWGLTGGDFGGPAASAWASVDGRGRTELCPGDFVTVRVYEYPVPVITKQGTHKDFIHAITSKLNWNVRERQNQLEATSDEDEPTKPKL